ncbi:deSI-like protein [Iris pallida]|uniref:DeSI-like protein n=1 Tax=Iris pallida TaxID=29817 RepID=A0AAX6GUM4_IRIPA|nr:deSI-like protein [Iris pallida]
MPSILARYSSTREQKINGGSGAAHVFLNVYDVTPVNNYLYWFGLGVFHSGIEVHGMEYGYGAHVYSSSGVFEVEPKSCPGFIYRRYIRLGTTDMSHSKFCLFLEHLSGKCHGNTYHLVSKNCSHFTDDVCTRLTGKPIPGWVNRLAKLGSIFNCLLPDSIHVTAVRHLPDNPAYSDGSESLCSYIEESDDDELDHHLLTTAPDSDPAHSRDKY